MNGRNGQRPTMTPSTRNTRQPIYHSVSVTYLRYGTDILKFDFQLDQVIHENKMFVPLNISPEDFWTKLQVCLSEVLPSYRGEWYPFFKPSDIIRTIVKMMALNKDGEVHPKSVSWGAFMRMIGHVFVVLLDPPNFCGSPRANYKALRKAALSNIQSTQQILPTESTNRTRDSKKQGKASSLHFGRDEPMLTINSNRKWSASQHGDTELYCDVKLTTSRKRKRSDSNPESLDNLAEEGAEGLDQPMSIYDAYSYVLDEVHRRHLQQKKNSSRRYSSILYNTQE